MKKFGLSNATAQKLEQRLKGYKSVLWGQFLSLIFSIVILDVLESSDFLFQVSFIIYSLIMVWLNYLTYILLKDLTDSIFVKTIILLFISLNLILGMTMPLEELNNLDVTYAWTIRTSIFMSLISFGTLIYYMTLDIFKEKHEPAYRLWGSASIFIAIGSAFSILYTFIESLCFPETVGIDLFLNCNKFSYFIISGMGAPEYLKMSRISENISIFESLISNLFVVLLVGRILSK